MSAPIGNRFWEQRSSHGRKPIFESPEQLWEAACEYFEWVTDNPLEESKAFSYQGSVIKTTLPKMRAMTITGMCLYLDISRQGWSEYCAKEDFSDITKKVEAVIFSQKFEGAAADLLNPNIIARELGLADKTDITTGGEPINKPTVIELVAPHVQGTDTTTT
ncbi:MULTISPECIES: DNA-packaging protein [Acinetobacter]|uniref:DNA-packaging protein n=1 Tax=Acinetobacter TaxID=469 RepID=UPI001F4B4471|nr:MULTISPECIES: DNA-packaging protein [Acinetobacter]MCH7381620.1 DNA-packaging protein [Acinetobacter higginsii]